MNRRGFIKLIGGITAAVSAGASVLPTTKSKWVEVKNYVIPTTTRLKAEWTVECGQDLMAFHDISAGEELKNVLTEYINDDIRKEMLKYNHSA